MKLRTVFFGALFGFVLSRVGATDYDAIAGMFMLTDLHLAGVIGAAVALSGLGFFVIRRRHAHTLRGEPIFLAEKQMTRYLVPGALLFGTGWALSGTCPGTSLAQIGEGHWAGMATFLGIVVGGCLAHPRSTQTAPSMTVLSRP
jgi:uncharacterized membrane protein YedE/YeeE